MPSAETTKPDVQELVVEPIRRSDAEFGHRTRFCFASKRMTCVLLVGSPPQSCAEQMMDKPSIIG